ncbi:hypothetical protein RMATCC62417_10931 [Rhizopus microsporus]|nr:hypothetical protein RMATCC62417_10931 [Rhizopus microsporus]
MNGVNLHVALNGITNYDEVVPSACETIATCCNNYYVENFENILAKCFIYIIRANYRNLPIGTIKSIVYDHLLDNQQAESLVIPETLLPEDSQIIPRLTEFVNESITPIRNGLLVIPLGKTTLSENLQDIIPVFRYILNIYEQQQPKVQ